MSGNITVIEINYLQDICKQILSSTDEDFIYSNFQQLVNDYTLLSFSMGHGRKMWRGRKSPKEGFEYVQELSYPTEENVRRGRMNNNKNSLLYTSCSQSCVFEEIDAREGEYVHIVGYCIKPEEQMKVYTVGEFLNVYRSGKAVVDISLGKHLHKIMSKMKEDELVSFVYIDAFFSSILRDKNASKSNYLHSHILASLLFDKFPDINSIIYPSIRLEGAMNIAIKPNEVDRTFASFGNFIVKINKKYEYGLYDFSLVREAKGQYADGRIHW